MNKMPQKYRFSTILVALLLLWSAPVARGDHYSGASITYECIGGNFFNITLDLFLDCSGTALTPQSLNFANDCGVVFSIPNVPLVLSEEVSQLCPSSLPNSTCNGGVLQGINHFQLQSTVFLSPCNNWTISWNICCRNTTVNLTATPGLYAEATVNNAGGACDRSPVIADNSIPFVCVNDPVLYNPGISDPDGNTMSFQFISARNFTGIPANVGYQTPTYTAAAPIPGVTLDPLTGQISFTPTVTGNYVVVLQVTTYDAMGVAIGTIMRDFMFVVVNCMGEPPVTTGLTNNTGGFIVDGSGMEVCEGVPFCVDIPFTDGDPGGTITLVSNAVALLPGATFTVIGTNPAVGRICWTPLMANSPANVLITATDNACPVPNVASISILFTVVQPPVVAPYAGTDASVASCSSGPAVALFPLIGGGPDPGGVWTDPDGVIHNGSFVPPGDPFGVYTYRVGNGCQTDAATVTVNSNGSPSPGSNGLLDICATAAAVPLINSLGGTPAAGGTWSGGVPAIVGGNYNPATMNPGVYTYTVAGVAPCPAATATVTVTESAGPNAGTNGTLSVCSNGAAVALFASLGGTPAAGGTWSGGVPAIVGGSYDPATMNAGVYTYTVTGIAPCANATATVTVTENPVANAGTNGTLTVCSSGAAVALSTGLGGTPDAGGSWSPAAPGGNYDPTTMAPGPYVYTVTGVAPCANSTATVTVTENAAPNAGLDGPLTVCSNGAAVALSTGLGGTPDAGGSWSPAAPGGNYDPATMAPGPYVYTVTGVAPCANATATITVTENTAPDAGLDGPLTVCSNGAAVALSTGLGGTPDAGGSWSPAAPGGNYDPATMAPGPYVYTVTGAATCANATATVTVTENAAQNAGVDGAITVCGNGVAVDLFAQLGGSPDAGGIWSGGLVGGMYDPAVNGPGAFTYTLAAVAPCLGDVSTVTVTENAPTDAGTDGNLTICTSSAAVALINSLGGSPQAGGTWSPAAPGGNYDPATMAPGPYTYTVTGVAPCTNASAIVTVNETGNPNAGTDGVITVCGNGAAVSLFAQLGGSPDAGGTWSGGLVGGMYDPAVNGPGAFTYTLAAVAPCLGDVATVTVTENAPTDAGTNGNLTICTSSAAVALINSLGGSPQAGGTWSPAAPGGNYDPATMAPGPYTYTVTGVAPCTNASATVTVAETGNPNAGTDGAITVCGNGAAVSLFAQLGGSPDAGGTWSGGLIGGMYDPSVNGSGAFTYTLAAVAPCLGDVATVTVTEEAATNAGTDAALNICAGASTQDLFDLLGSNAQSGGTWSGPTNPFDGIFDPGSDLAGLYTYSITGVVCPNDVATVAVIVAVGPDAGQDNTIALCNTNGPVNLNSLLLGTPDVGGVWADADGIVVPALFNPSNMTGGTFTYTVLGNSSCPADAAVLQLTVNAAPHAGTSGSMALCTSSAPVSLFDGLTGNLDIGGTWTGPSGQGHSSTLDPAVDTSGVYMYRVAGTAPCLDATSTVVVVNSPEPYAGENGAAIFCSSDLPLALISLLNGTPQTNGVWRDPDGNIEGSSFAPGTGAPGVHTYTITGIAPCGVDVSTVTIAVSTAANAGVNASISVCENSDDILELITALGGSPEASGTWYAPDSSLFDGSFDPNEDVGGAYFYTVSAPAPCPVDTAVLTITVIPIPVADIQVDGNEGCTPALVTLSNSYTGNGSCTWILWNGDVINDCAPIEYVFEEEGTYDVILIIDAGDGCGADTVQGNDLIHIYQQPIAEFYWLPEAVNTVDPEVQFNNASIGGTNFLWTIADLDTATSYNTNYRFPDVLGAEYEVCLVAAASSFCADTVCHIIEVEDGLAIFVPNAFTPDGDDINEGFKPIVGGVDLRYYHFDIFDRWGQQLFGTDDPNAVWNGLFTNGTDVPIGVYVWKLLAKDPYTGKRIERIGHVTLVR